MTFFQNPFHQDFQGTWIISDRQYNLTFKCPLNSGRGDEVVFAWNEPNYDLSGNDADGDTKNVLTISFSLNDNRNWSDVAITITASSLSSTTPAEVISSLEANTVFNDFFEAENVFHDNGKQRLSIKQKLPVHKFKFYIKNGRAEEGLGFNKRAGVSELPTFFERHTIANRFTYNDSAVMLISLDPSGSNVDADIIDNAVDAYGKSKEFDSSTVQEDYELLRGKVGEFVFRKLTVDGSNRITEIIEYNAGSIEGDTGKKTEYTYTGANTNPDQITEIPYVLQSGDLVTP